MKQETLARQGLILLCIFFVLTGIAYHATTPIFESPDESSHLKVIRYLARERQLYPPTTPVMRVISGTDMAESLRYHNPPIYYTPPLYHTLGALIAGENGLADLEARLIPSPSWEAQWAPVRDGDAWNKNVYAHLPGETWRASASVRTATLLRMISLALGLSTLVCTYHIGRTLFPEQPLLSLGAAACVGLNPQFVSLSAGVTNDPLTGAIFSLTLLLALRAMRDAAKWPRWAAIGALVGLGLLTKQSALLLLPLGGLAILGQGEYKKLPPWPKILADGLAFGINALLIGGAWYLHNALNYNDVMGLRTHFESQVALSQFGLREILAIFETYWAGFGWALISAPRWYYGFAGAVVAIAAAGAIRAVLKKGTADPERRLITRRGMVILDCALLLNMMSLVRWAIATGAPYGRLLFPSISAIGILLAWGLSQWQHSRLFKGALLGSVLLAGGFTALVPWTLLAPAFAPAQYTGELPQGVQTAAASFTPQITLAGYSAPTRDLYPGDSVDVTFYWEALKAPGQRYNVWVQWGPQDATQFVAAQDRWLGGTLYPSELWSDGAQVRQSHTLNIPKTIAAPGLYWVRVGLVDGDGERVQRSDSEGEGVSLGPWRVRQRRRPAALPGAADYTLGESIALQGYAIERQADRLTLTLAWEAKTVPPADYKVFVHMVDESGTIVAQHDGIPKEGDYPTSWWRDGDWIHDTHTLDLPTDWQGAVKFYVGMYDPQTDTRVPAYDQHGQRLANDSIEITVAKEEISSRRQD